MTAFGGAAMWRVVLATSLMLTLAVGAVAEAKCEVCLESVRIETQNGGTLLRFTLGSSDPARFPETGTAVVMQFDGNRGKCLTVSLVRTGIQSGNGPDQWAAVATYVGRFDFVYRGASTLSGRADIAGTVWDFNAPIDGQPGAIGVGQVGALSGAGQVIPNPVITPDPSTIDPRTAAATAAAQVAAQSEGAPAPTTPTLIDGVAGNTVGLLGLIVVVVAIVSAYLDRKRSIARATAG